MYEILPAVFTYDQDPNDVNQIFQFFQNESVWSLAFLISRFMKYYNTQCFFFKNFIILKYYSENLYYIEMDKI